MDYFQCKKLIRSASVELKITIIFSKKPTPIIEKSGGEEKDSDDVIGVGRRKTNISASISGVFALIFLS